MCYHSKFFLSIVTLLNCALINAAIHTQNSNSTTTQKKTTKAITNSHTEKISKPVTIKNGITKHDIGYQKLGWRYPDQFTVTINGEKLFDFDGKKIDQKDIILKNNPKDLIVRYSYTWHAPWPWGTKKGSKTARFALDPQKKILT